MAAAASSGGEQIDDFLDRCIGTMIGRVIKPLLAGVVRPFGRPPNNQTPVDQHYVWLREQLNRTFETVGLAAA
jgi:hypothetical protein